MATLISQNNVAAGYRAHKKLIDEAAARVLNSGWYILGKEVAAFEQQFADYVAVEGAVGVASGTDAVEVALRACGIGAGDLVYTVSHTAVATVVGIERSGASAVLVDVDRDSFTMCPMRLEEAFFSAPQAAAGKPAAIVPVHLYGQMADMPAIVELGRRHGLKVIEDCAQAHGASIDGRRAGSWGDAAAFSFFPTKNLGAVGDAGAVLSNDKAVLEKAREIRQYGWRQRQVSSLRGINSRLDELQAAVLGARLKVLEADNAGRRQAARDYDQGLATLPLELPAARRDAEHVYHQYVVRVDDRDGLRAFLKDRSIATAIHYPKAIHQQPAYAGQLAGSDRLPVTDELIRKIVSLPMYPQLGGEDLRTIVTAIRDWARW